jgi:hypothetical protein
LPTRVRTMLFNVLHTMLAEEYVTQRNCRTWIDRTNKQNKGNRYWYELVHDGPHLKDRSYPLVHSAFFANRADRMRPRRWRREGDARLYWVATRV